MGIRPFSDTLTAIRFGQLQEELSAKLNELTTACMEEGKGGKLTLVLSLKPGKAGQVEILDDVKLTLPPREHGSTLMFATPEGNLQREDPRQMQLEGLRAVTAPAPLKEIAS
jgi:hypothetical protein